MWSICGRVHNRWERQSEMWLLQIRRKLVIVVMRSCLKLVPSLSRGAREFANGGHHHQGADRQSLSADSSLANQV